MSTALNNISLGILTSLTDNLINNAENVGVNTGLLGALNTAENLTKADIIRIANDGGVGTQKQVRVVTKQRGIASESGDSKTCDPGQEMLYEEEVVTINNVVETGFQLTEATVRQYDDSYSELVRLTGSKTAKEVAIRANEMGQASTELSVIRELFSDFMLSFDGHIQAVNIKLLQALQAAKGTWVGGNTSKSYVVQNGATYANGGGSINANGLLALKQDLRQSMFRGTPHIVGGYGAMDRIYQQDSRYFGQGANGIDFSQARAAAGQEFRFFTDENVESELGDHDDALIFYPGSANFLPYLQYVGNYGDIGNMKRFTMAIPQLPSVKVDVRILPDECGEFYNVWLDQFFEMYTPGMQLFKAGDNLEGVNGVFAGTFTQA